mmetsp:Transcript_10952/g.16439  ORF Transcript_10952/g.16439 Transcript_10952/m.16439 type:complete len:545 (+) Transcript_10952:301-1935(+)|eukprot:CAMPEP_0196816758 /NCGR_PEP_ID=MMETSP1362-20130617/56926_1 /TAXON_ID=163516 /ORGANISM="Leptocylindrus danicus, Strain CCMP1856" /LENGTH=544 /DNA_ID=CAMNT_0042194207 /DNA_START=236 /DNA_END=1870 /DNA_ORIENTATION=+
MNCYSNNSSSYDMDAVWYQNFHAFKLYTESHGYGNAGYSAFLLTNCGSDHDSKQTGASSWHNSTMHLSSWIKQQRLEYDVYCKGNRRSSVLDGVKVALLNEIGFEWTDENENGSMNHQRYHFHPSRSRTNPNVASGFPAHSQSKGIDIDNRPVVVSAKIKNDKENLNMLANAITAHEKMASTSSVPKSSLPAVYAKETKGKTKKTSQKRKKVPRKSAQEAWDVMFAKLLKYKEENGDCLVPSRYPKDQQLGYWVVRQREHYKHGCADNGSNRGPMPKDRIEMLEKAGFVWDAKRKEIHWMQMLNKLKEHKEKTGHCDVRTANGTIVDKSLDMWSRKQRFFYWQLLKDKPSFMTEERIMLLDKVGFPWDRSNGANEEIWELMFEQLHQFKRDHGHTHVPNEGDYKVRHLHAWAEEQRKIDHEQMGAYTSTTLLATRRVSRLQELSFQFHDESLNKKVQTAEEECALTIASIASMCKAHDKSILTDETRSAPLRERIVSAKGSRSKRTDRSNAIKRRKVVAVEEAHDKLEADRIVANETCSALAVS